MYICDMLTKNRENYYAENNNNYEIINIVFEERTVNSTEKNATIQNQEIKFYTSIEREKRIEILED